MTATQAPTPGPLDSESVKLLVKGDLLRHVAAPNVFRVFRMTSGEWPDLWLHMVGEPHTAHMVDRWLFEARTDADGWMPWSGGENPVGDAVVEIKLRNGATSTETASGFPWSHDECTSYADIIAFRLAPIEASGSERETDAWKWLGQLYPNDAPSDLAYDANEMVDAFLAGSGRSDRMAKALERIADEQQYRSGYCQTDITVEPALTAEEAQTVARDALSTTPARAEAQDEDTPCTDCGDTGVTHQTERRCSCQEAEAQDEGAAGKWPALAIAQAEYDHWIKEALKHKRPKGLRSDCENRDLERARIAKRILDKIAAHPSPTPAADADRVRKALEPFAALAENFGCWSMVEVCAPDPDNPSPVIAPVPLSAFENAAAVVAALKSTAAKEGGEV